MLATLRSGERAADSVVALWKDGLAERLELQPLGPEAIAELVVPRARGAGRSRDRAHAVGPHPRQCALRARARPGRARIRRPAQRRRDLADDRQPRVLRPPPRDRRCTARRAQRRRPRHARPRCRRRAARGRDLRALGRQDRPRGAGAPEPCDDPSLTAAHRHPSRPPALRRGHARADVAATHAQARHRPRRRAAVDRRAPARGHPADRDAAPRRRRRARAPPTCCAPRPTRGERFDMPLAERLARAAFEAGAGFDAGMLLGQLCWWQGRPADAEHQLHSLVDVAQTDAQRAALATTRMDVLGLSAQPHRRRLAGRRRGRARRSPTSPAATT